MIKCPICNGYEFAQDDDYDICNVCGWENDGLQLDDPDDWGGANDLSLNNTRLEYSLLTNPSTSRETQAAKMFHVNANSAIHVKYENINHQIDGDKWSGELRKEYERYVDVLEGIAKRAMMIDGSGNRRTTYAAAAV